MKRKIFKFLIFVVLFILFSCNGAQTEFMVILFSNPIEGGEVIGQGEYKSGQEVTIRAIANDEEGYVFADWTNEANEIVSELAEYTFIMPNNDLTLTANFGIPYTVTFDKNGGDSEADPRFKEVVEGKTVKELPNPPDREGYFFEEWNKEQDGSGEVFTENTIVENNITVYAQWSIRNYIVNIIIDPEEAGIVVGEGNYEYEILVSLIATPNVDFEFDKWEIPEELELIEDTTINDNEIKFIMPANDLDIKANFVEIGFLENNIVGDVNFNMVLAPAAVFPIGYIEGELISSDAYIPPYGEEENEKSFWIGETAVNYELWYEVRIWAENNDYIFQNPGKEGSEGVNGEPPTANKNHPVTNVSWRDAIVWCNALSEMVGLDPVYNFYIFIDGALRPIVIKNATNENRTDNAFQINNNGFRLPTILEWELAARYIGQQRPTVSPLREEAILKEDGLYWTPGNYASGAYDSYMNPIANIDVAMYELNSEGRTSPVGQLRANQLGLFDMCGNVWEWCFDKPTDKDYRVYRGGSWINQSKFLQLAIIATYDTEFHTPSYNSNHIGLRLVKNYK